MSRVTAARSAAIAIVVFLLGLGLPVTGLVTKQVGMVIVVVAMVIGATLVITPLEHRLRLALLRKLPVGFRSPVYPKSSTPKPVRPPAALGALDFELAMTKSTERYGKVLSQLTKDTERSGAVATKYTPRMKAAKDASTEARIKVSRDYAREQSKVLDSTERRAVELAEVGAEVRENSIQRIRAFPNDTDLSEFRTIMAGLGPTIDESKQSITGLRAAVVTVRSQGIQQDVNEAADRHIEALDRILAEFDAMRQYVRDAVNEIDLRSGSRPARRAARRARSDAGASKGGVSARM